MSEECVKSELDLFTVPLTQTAIEKNTYIEVPPISAITATGPIEFFIASSGEDYTDLNNTLLYVRLKIVKPDGGDIGDDTPVGLINYPGATIFSQIDISLGDRLISQSSNAYPYRSIIECLVNYDVETLESNFSAGLFYKDTALHMDDRPGGENLGLNARQRYTFSSDVVELMAPIHSDMFFQEKLLLNGVDVKIRLTRAKDEFCLMRSDAINYQIHILSASLFVKKVTLSPPFRLGHAQALLSSTAKYPHDHVNLKSYSIPAGSRVSNHENIFLGRLPKSIIIGMVDNDAYTGSYAKNPFAFKNYNLEFLALYLDGVQHPGKPFQPDYTKNAAVREYYQMVLATGRHLKNNSLAFDKEEFSNGYTLYAFNLTPDENNGPHLSLIKSGSLRLETRFRTPLPQTINLIVYAVYDSMLEVSNRRQILIDHP